MAINNPSRIWERSSAFRNKKLVRRNDDFQPEFYKFLDELF